jgi:PAS domain-containing protein
MNPIDVSQLLSALPVPVALVDVSGRITLANSAWGAAFDCEVDRIRGIPLAEHLLLRDPSKLKHALGKLSARRATQLQLDCELAKSLQQGIAGGEGGSWVELNLRRFDLLGESPDATQPMIAVSVLDVSEARTLSLQAAQAEARLASLTDQIKVGIVILHANDELLLINHSAAAFLGVNQAGPSLPGLSRDEFLMQASLLAVGERNVLANAQPDSNHQLRLKAPVAGASSLDIKCVSVVVDGESGGTLWMVEPVDSEGNSGNIV